MLQLAHVLLGRSLMNFASNTSFPSTRPSRVAAIHLSVGCRRQQLSLDLKQPLVCSGVEKETAEKIQKAIEAAGAEFIDEAKRRPRKHRQAQTGPQSARLSMHSTGIAAKPKPRKAGHSWRDKVGAPRRPHSRVAAGGYI